MTLHLHRSNDLDALVKVLAALPPLDPPDPFEPETIVLQTRGMERWLTMRLADLRGVFAHGRFLSLDDLFDELMQTLMPAPDAAHWRPGQLVWRIAEVLRGAASDPELSALSAWLASTDLGPIAPDAAGPTSASAALPDQIVQLAWRVAEVFHRYALHRPDMVDAWERNDPRGPGPSEPAPPWQPALWRRLAAGIAAPHPGRRLTLLIEHLAHLAPTDRGDDRPPPALPPPFPRRLVLFGHHTLAPLHVRALAALGRHLEVHLFHPAIGPGRGGDRDVARHPLRASLGRLLDQLDQLLAEHAPDAVRHEHLVRPRDDTLLHRLQRAIFDGRIIDDLRPAHPDPAPASDPPDLSLQLHACASPLRQVEVLRDELLALFSADRTLEPRHVIVMTPNMETYAPLIDAVFRDGDRDLPPDNPLSAGFPPIHRLHDLSLRRVNPIAESFLAILDLAGGRYTLSEISDLLAMPPILAKAGLIEEELPRLVELVQRAHVRWARDEHHRAAESLPATRRNTWAGGFDRLLLGHALASTGVDDFLGVVPVDDVEGKDETRTLGLFVDYLERLFDELADLHEPRTVSAWRTRLAALVQTLLVHDDTSAGLAQAVLDVLGDLVTRAERGGFSGALELGAMRGLLADPLEARRPSITFLSGGLTFCTFLPMRTIPFRVVCLLGMDDGEFPRSPHGLGFDLLENQSEPGDRSAREDDRMTFLETLAAARDHLLVTWTGYRATDKRELDAAGPVAELVETVRRGLGADVLPAPTFVRHPLQPFTPNNFRLPPMSFDLRYLRGARRIVGERQPPPPHWDGQVDAELPAVISLDKLVDCFVDPSRWFCRERLRVWLAERDTSVEDREPLALNALELWALRDRVLGWELDAIDPEQRMRALEATGQLPFGAAGRLALRQIEDDVRAIAERVRALRAAAWREHLATPGRPPSPPPHHPDPIGVALRLGGVDLVGQLDFVYGTQRIAHQAGKVKPKNELALWVRHLALAATLCRPVTSYLVGQDRVARLVALAPARARELLTRLVGLHLAAHRTPLPFFPATAFHWLEGRPPGAPIPSGADVPPKARDEWRRRFDQEDVGDGVEAHAAMLFDASGDGDFPFDDSRFHDAADALWGPLMAAPDGAWTADPMARVLRSEAL